jgi:hypothetical protein
MHLLTIKGGWWCNRRFEIDNGSVRIWKDGGQQESTLTVNNGQITEIEDVERPVSSPGEKIITTREKKQIDRTKWGVIRIVSRYKSYWNLPTEGVFHEVQGLKLGKHKGTLRQISRNGRFVREEFTYSNGQQAYIWTPYRKKFRLYRPNGSLWLEVTAKIRTPWKRTKGLLEKIRNTLFDITSHGHTWSNQPDYEIRLYDARGRQSDYGKVSNRQRAGIWQQGKAKHYFMMGVAVSKEVFNAGPDDLDPRDVLKTDNAQLRAALMKKIGPERLINKLPFTACDIDGDNQLLKVHINRIFASDNESTIPVGVPSGFDEQLAIVVLKCPSTGQLYYLRVPPRLNKVEHARQWLCGIDIESVEEEYIRERLAGSVNGEPVNLTPLQEVTLNTEIVRARQRQRLEFVSEA